MPTFTVALSASSVLPWRTDARQNKPLEPRLCKKDHTQRVKLYKITEETIRDILKELNLSDGEHSIVKDVAGFKYPIKVVVAVEKGIVTVITNYPLKKGKKK